MLRAVVTTLLKQAKPCLIKLVLGNSNSPGRLADHHLLHQGIEQVEPAEQPTAFSTNCSPQLRNHRSAIHKSTATREP